MTATYERELRHRFRRAQLPAAPESLTALVATVSATQPTAGPRFVTRFVGQLLAGAAVVAIAAVAILGGGSPVPPSSGATTRPASGAARLVVKPTVWQPCGPIGCAFHLAIDGPGVAWTSELGFAALGEVAPLTVSPPSTLSSGLYNVRAEIHVISDAIEAGQTAGADLGMTATCSSPLDIPLDATVVEVTTGFWLDRCTVGAVVAKDPSTLASVGVTSSIDGACGGAIEGCEYRLQLSGPGGSWATVLRSPNPSDQIATSPDLFLLLPAGRYRLDASAHRMSDEPSPGAGHREEVSVATTCTTEFTIAGDINYVSASASFESETCSIEAQARVLTSGPPGVISPVPTVEAQSYRIICEVSDPAEMPCDDIVDAVLAYKEAHLSPASIVEIVVTRDCAPCDPGSDGATATVVLGPPSLSTPTFSVQASPEGPTVLAFMSSERSLDPPYGDEPTRESTIPIEAVALLANDTLKVRFFANTCQDVSGAWVGGDVARLRVAIIAPPDEARPSRAACEVSRLTYALGLPEPFTGAEVEDVRTGQVFQVVPG